MPTKPLIRSTPPRPPEPEYRPDFYLPEYDLYIEHFAIDEQGRTPPFIDQAAYTEGMAWKRHTHQEHHTTLIETYSYLVRDGRLFDELERQLTAHGVVCQPRSLEEVLGATGVISSTSVHQLTRLIARFLTVFKSSGKDMADLRHAARAAKDGGRAQAFLEVFEPVLARYTQELRANARDRLQRYDQRGGEPPGERPVSITLPVHLGRRVPGHLRRSCPSAASAPPESPGCHPVLCRRRLAVDLPLYGFGHHAHESVP